MMAVTVIGYSSMDHSMRIGSFQGAGHTTLIEGGAGAVEAGGIARIFDGLEGCTSRAVSWVGQDELSLRWIRALQSVGVDVSGVQALEGHMPTSYLFHAGSGESLCFYDAGIGAPHALTSEARTAIKDADSLVVAIGPTAMTEAALDLVSDNAVVVWVVKADPVSFPLALRQQLVHRADVILHSHQEDDFLRSVGARPRSDALIVRTAGESPIVWQQGEQVGSVDVEPITGPINATGAGDHFAGCFLGAYLRQQDVERSLQTAADATRGFLQYRRMTNGEPQ